MIFFKKILILLIVIAAMYLTYLIVNFLKAKINVHRNMGAFLLLLLLSFATVSVIILFLGFVFTEYRNFFFKH
jgi:hypothetical protein